MAWLICEGWRCNPHLDLHETVLARGAVRYPKTVDGEVIMVVGLSEMAKAKRAELPPLLYTEHVAVKEDVEWQCTQCGQVRRWG